MEIHLIFLFSLQEGAKIKLFTNNLCLSFHILLTGCFIGDAVDGVPGIQKHVPSFGPKTAKKLLKKHGNLENLLNAAAIKIVGRDYAQDALTKYADYLRRNYQVLSLRRY